MKLLHLQEARYVGGPQPIEEFYALYDLSTKRFIKFNSRNLWITRAQSIRTTVLFNTEEEAQQELDDIEEVVKI